MVTAWVEAPAEPVNDGAADQESEQSIGVQQVEDHFGLNTQRLLQKQDQREDHRRGADDGGSDKNRLRGRFEGVSAAVVLFKIMLAYIQPGLNPNCFSISLSTLGMVSIRESS